MHPAAQAGLSPWTPCPTETQGPPEEKKKKKRNWSKRQSPPLHEGQYKKKRFKKKTLSAQCALPTSGSDLIFTMETTMLRQTQPLHAATGILPNPMSFMQLTCPAAHERHFAATALAFLALDMAILALRPGHFGRWYSLE